MIRNAFDLFVESFVSDTKLSEDEAPRYWDMLPPGDKSKFQKKLKELKEKYIKDYRKFLKVSVINASNSSFQCLSIFMLLIEILSSLSP